MSVAQASLIITVLNEASSIGGFLDSLRSQITTPAEVVVVDGGSSDGTADVVRQWSAPEGVTVILIESPGAGISEGRNIAIRAASHERLLVTDAGTTVEPEWSCALLEAAEATGADVVSGFFYPTGSSFLERAFAFAITPTLDEVEPASFLPSSRSVSFTKSAWAHVGGYPEWLDYCEDLVFDIAIRDAGFSFAFEPKAQVSWSARPTMKAYIKQYYRYARGDGKSGLWAKRHAVRYAAYLGGAVLVAGSFAWPWLALILIACASAYLAKFWRRVYKRRRQFGRGWAGALLSVPVIVIAGDVAKMIGYPAGLLWRRQRGEVEA